MSILFKKVSMIFYVVIAICYCNLAFSEEKPTKNIASVFVVVAKTGQSIDLEKAIKSHGDYRRKMKDPRKWEVYAPVTGNNLGVYFIRFCCDDWADHDAYDAWSMKSKTLADWNKKAGPHIAKIGFHLERVDLKNGRWNQNEDFNFVGVTNYKVKMGHGDAVSKDKKILSDAAKSGNWPYSWSWDTNIDGSFTMSLAVPYKNFAAMKQPEVSFAEILTKHLGSKEKAATVLKRWGSHFKSRRYSIYRLRKDLSN